MKDLLKDIKTIKAKIHDLNKKSRLLDSSRIHEDNKLLIENINDLEEKIKSFYLTNLKK